MAGEREADRPTLWIDRAAETVKADRLARALLGEGGERYGIHLLLVLIIGLDLLVPPLLVYAQRGAVVMPTPAKLALLPIWLGIVTVMQWLRAAYANVASDLADYEAIEADELRELWGLSAGDTADRPGYVAWLRRLRLAPDGDDRTVLAEPAPAWLVGVFVLLAIGLHASWFVLDPSPMSFVTEAYGPTVAAVEFYLVVPLVYYPIGAELAALFVGIFVLLPLKIAATDRIDFTDPSGFAGLRPVGRLLRNAGGAYILLLILYVAFEMAAPSTGPGDPFGLLILGLGTGVGLVGFFGPVLWLHKYMHRRKRERITLLKALIATRGPEGDDDVFPDTLLWRGEKYDDYDPEHYREYHHLYFHLSRVQNTREYPVDVGLALEFLFVLAIPLAAHLAWTYVFQVVLGH